MMFPNFNFIEEVEAYEPVFLKKIYLKIVKEKQKGTSNLMNRVVYDSIDPSPFLSQCKLRKFFL